MVVPPYWKLVAKQIIVWISPFKNTYLVLILAENYFYFISDWLIYDSNLLPSPFLGMEDYREPRWFREVIVWTQFKDQSSGLFC